MNCADRRHHAPADSGLTDFVVAIGAAAIFQPARRNFMKQRR
jgi:hypothetical protein